MISLGCSGERPSFGGTDTDSVSSGPQTDGGGDSGASTGPNSSSATFADSGADNETRTASTSTRGDTDTGAQSSETGDDEVGDASRSDDSNDDSNTVDSTDHATDTSEPDAESSAPETDDSGGETGTATPDDPCAQEPCEHGTCEVEGDAYTCDCEDGYDGDHCDLNIDDCNADACEHGECIDGVDSYTCNCDETGFTGERCEIEIQNCAQSPCQNEGECTDSGASRTCDCSGTGFEGDSCEDDIDECDTEPCDPLTECNNLAGSFSCTACPSGYTGDGKSGCDNVNECLTDNGGCDDLTECVDTMGGRTCGECPTGYSGNGETGCIDIDDCSSDPCRNGGVCTDGVDSFSCDCVGPWSGDICGNATLTVNATARGYYTNVTWNISSGNTVTGWLTGGLQYHSYFVFPLPEFTGSVDSVTLRLEHELYESGHLSESFAVFDVSTPIDELVALEADPLGTFDDLGTGTQYGTFTLNESTVDSIRNILLVGAINDVSDSRDADFAIGIAGQTLALGDTNEYARFSFSDEARTHQLQIVVVP
jgi:hypothetical protein